jgi:hypothetical protein
LRRILDLHNQLYENDGYDIALPVNMALYTVPRFYCRLEEISATVQERKGLQECLSLLKLPLVDEYSNDEDIAGHAADVTDTNESQHPPAIRHESEQASADEHGSPEHYPSGSAQFDVQSGDSNINQETNISNVDGQRTIREGSEEPEDKTFVASDSPTTKISENPGLGHVSSAAESGPSGEEEELLEYEDDENDSAQTPAEQPTYHNNMGESLTRGDSAIDAEGGAYSIKLLRDLENAYTVRTEGQSFSDNVVSPSQHSGEEHDDADERSHPAVPTANGSNWDGSPSNLDDDSSNKPSPIPVFGGDDNEVEYDNQQHNPEAYGYEQGGQRDLYQERPERDAENGYDNIERNFNDEQDDGTGDVESYAEESFQGDGFATEENQYVDRNHPDLDEYDESGDYYEEVQGDYTEHEETQLIQGDVELEEYEFEEYNDSHFENAEVDSPDEVEVVNDPSTTDAIDITTRSPVLSTHEEELIDYEDDEDDQPPAKLLRTTSNMSPTSLKRFREDSNDQDDDGELDEIQGWSWRSRGGWMLSGNLVLPASKRARAE